MAGLNPRRRRALALPFALLPGVMWALTGCDRGPAGGDAPSFKSIDITGAQYARQLSLPDADGVPRSLDGFRGKVVVVFFGYTQCPDVCPTTMADLAEVKRQLGADGGRVVGLFVTVDPERDSAELLKAYVANFGPDIIALRGSADDVKAAAQEFKVFYSRAPGRTDGSYTIDHTAGSYVIDSRGRVRLYARHGIGVKALADDLRILLAERS